jgi:hypothetical protein
VIALSTLAIGARKPTEGASPANNRSQGIGSYLQALARAGYKSENWDLFCLDPNASPLPTKGALKEELALVEKIEQEEQASKDELS